MSYVIGSFNLRDFNFANKSADGTNEKVERDFQKIAHIILSEQFDVIALQELNSELALQYLTSVLNRSKTLTCEYECVFGEKMHDGKSSLGPSRDPERYGFIWNAKRLRLLQTRRNNNPGYYRNAGANDLIRPPYYARFTARGMLNGSNFELRIVNTHIRDASCEADRITEFDVLVRKVLPRICDHQEISEAGEIMPAYTFLVGDYNLALNKGERAVYRIEKITPTSYTGRLRSYHTVQEEATTLKHPKDQQTIEACYNNNYDHFTYEIDLDTKLQIVPQRVEALTKYFPEEIEPVSKLTEYRKKVSDHVPIKLTVDLRPR